MSLITSSPPPSRINKNQLIDVKIYRMFLLHLRDWLEGLTGFEHRHEVFELCFPFFKILIINPAENVSMVLIQACWHAPVRVSNLDTRFYSSHIMSYNSKFFSVKVRGRLNKVLYYLNVVMDLHSVPLNAV